MSFTMLEENFWAENGFDELRRLMNQGSDFVKESMAILQERSDIEKQYATKLQQLSTKIRRANSLCIGSLAEAWQKFGDNIENESDIHKNLSQDIMTECFAPLKAFLDEKLRLRKPLEASVDKQKKVYSDKFNEQLKMKKVAHTQCKELEQNLDHLESLKARRTSTTDEELNKVEENVRKSEESLVKADQEYKDSNFKTEELRLAWESSMYRCCRHLEELEHIRLEELSKTMKKYSELMLTIILPLQESNEELATVSDNISADRDIELMCQSGTGPNQPEQLLLDTYEEDMSNHMNLERRQNNLDKKIQEFEMDIDKKEKEKKGVMSLSAAYEQTPDFVDEQGAADVTRKITDANSMLNMLKANHFKLLSARSEISNLPTPDSPYTEYMSIKKDRQNQTMTILSMPIDQVSASEEQTQAMPIWTPPSPLEELFVIDSDYKSFEEQDVYIRQCEVLYGYDGQLCDELTIRPGDIIYVTIEINNDWWEGKLADGRIGIFPTSYVRIN